MQFPRNILPTTLAPLLAVLCVLLGDPISTSSPTVGHETPATYVFSFSAVPVEETFGVCVTGLPIGAMPAPRAGRLRVREADRLGPSRLHLPPPMI